MLKIANKPMLLYGLEHLRNAGIREIAIVLGPIKEGVVDMLGDGSQLGVKITYIDQPEPRGLAHAVLIAERFMAGEPFVMYLGDNMLKEGVKRFVEIFSRDRLDCLVGVCPVENPSRFGIVEMDGGRIMELEEKPKEPKSNLALIGVYVFGPAIFDAVKKIKPSQRNELEITDAIQTLLSDGGKVAVEHVTGWWKDTGNPSDLLEANQLVLSSLETSIDGTISSASHVTGSLALGSGSKVIGQVTIRGPVIVGRNCSIGPNVFLGPYTSIDDECTISDSEIENSIVMKGSRIEAHKRIVDSLIGNYSTILSGEESLPKGYRLTVGDRSFVQL
jgi:glucose-1-phosphate thymidylyltransferase